MWYFIISHKEFVTANWFVFKSSDFENSAGNYSLLFSFNKLIPLK
jgi:hypothetical protein